MRPGVATGRRAYLRRYWINARRWRFWALVLLLAYTIAGFVGVPWALRSAAVATLASSYSRELRMEAVRFNPYTFALEIRELALRDIDGARVVGLDRLLVDFTLASAWTGAWTFDAVHVEGLSIREERFAPGTTRMGMLVHALAGAPDSPAEPAPESDSDPQAGGGLPPLLIRDLRLVGGQARFIDHVPDEQVELAFAPVTLRVTGLDTRPQRSGQTRLRMAFGSGGSLEWRGGLQLVPLQSSGRVTLDGVVLDPLLPYLQRFLALRDLEATLAAAFDYRVGLPPEGPRLEVTGLEAALRGVKLTAFEPETEFLAAEALRVKGVSYGYREARLDIDSATIDEPALRTWLTADGEPALAQLLRTDAASASAAPADGPGQAQRVHVDAFRINGLNADFRDRSVEPAASLGLRGVNFAVDGFALAPGSTADVRLDGALASGGTVAFDGRAQVRPRLDVAGELQVDDLRLAPAEPYLRQFARVRLAGGTLGLAGRLASTTEEPLAYTGNLRVDGLDVRAGATDEALLGWHALRIDEVGLRAGAGRLRTSVIHLQQPFARVAIAEDRSTNIGRLLVDTPAGDDAGTAKEDGGFDYTIGGLALADGELDFSDRSLPLPFATRVHGLQGRISTLASASREPTGIALEGQVDEYGLARIDGRLDPARPTRRTDIRMAFRNLAMPAYSPYAAEFAGRRIAAGRMDLDLAYRIDEGRLEANNNIVLTDLELGEKVDNPDAIDLPLGLAVALLKDSNGVIDIELPVSGNVNDPEFRMGGVIRQALATLIKKIVSSPFRLLASLVGLESGELDRVEFLAGRSDLTPPQRERVEKLAAALARRPELVLELTGTFAPALDRPALQRRQALAALRARLEEQGVAAGDVLLTDEAAREALTAMYREAFPGADLQALRQRFTRIPADLDEEEAEDAEPVFDAVAYRAYLAREVIRAQAVPTAELAALARARAERVRAALTGGDDAVADERVRIAEPASKDVDEGERVAIELGLATD